MDQQEYLKQRVDDQLAWFGKKSSWNQKRFKAFRTATIGCSVMIPVLSGLMAEVPFMNYIVGFLGAMVALFEGILSLNKYQENWVHYRATAETLKREKLLFLTQSGNYKKSEDPFHLFVQQVESILQSENQTWKENITQEEENG